MIHNQTRSSLHCTSLWRFVNKTLLPTAAPGPSPKNHRTAPYEHLSLEIDSIVNTPSSQPPPFHQYHLKPAQSPPHTSPSTPYKYSTPLNPCLSLLTSNPNSLDFNIRSFFAFDFRLNFSSRVFRDELVDVDVELDLNEKSDCGCARKVMKTDVDRVFYCARTASKIWREQKNKLEGFTYGSFIATSSMSGQIVNILQLQSADNAEGCCTASVQMFGR